jgi:aminoglycoside phosphotransferase (APT) family kinase protein
LPISPSVWTHGDPDYGNVVYASGGGVRALIDWEFAAPGDALVDPAGLLALSIRGPRPDADDPDRRARAAQLALDAIADGYAMSQQQRRRLPQLAAIVIDDAVAYWVTASRDRTDLDAHRWRARWFREHDDSFS